MNKGDINENKKGELTTQQIVILIIIIVSFIVLIYFLFRLNPNETSAEQICYNSVVLMSKSSSLVGSLDCKTNYLCLSGGDSCTGFNPTSTLKVDTAKKDEVLKALADEMADCWWMFGEGEKDYAAGLLASSTHCAICSKTRFDKKIQDKIKEVTYSELADYMKTHQSSHDASQSYLKYLYGVSSLDSSNSQLKDFTTPGAVISTSNEYAIITGIDPQAPYIWGDKNLPVQIVRADEINTKTGCQVFDITKS